MMTFFAVKLVIIQIATNILELIKNLNAKHTRYKYKTPLSGKNIKPTCGYHEVG